MSLLLLHRNVVVFFSSYLSLPASVRSPAAGRIVLPLCTAIVILAWASPGAAQGVATVTATSLLPVEDAYPHVSHDSMLVFQSNRMGGSKIFVAALDGTGLRQLTTGSSQDVTPVWSPDGQFVAFAGTVNGNEDIYIVARDGTGLRNVTNHPAGDSHPSWHPDGRHLVITSNRGDGENDDVYVIALDGSDVRRLTDNGPHQDTFPSFAPDGSRIVFRRLLVSRTNEGVLANSEVMVMNPDGSGVVNLSRHPFFDGWPSWSPDGQRIAFSSNRADGFQIFVMQPDGSGITKVVDSHFVDLRPQWLPDGSGLAFNREHDGRIELMTVRVH